MQSMAGRHNNFSLNFFQTNGTIEEAQVQKHPLNHTQMPRLINMRIVSEKKRSRRNFLNILLEKNSPLYRERIVRKKAMVHWFLKGEDSYENQVLVEKTAIHGAIIESLARAKAEKSILNDVASQFYIPGVAA